MMSETKDLPHYQFISISKTGTSHEAKDIVNQDAIAYEYDDADFVLAVADGVGSCALAHLGSRAAVQAVCEAFYHAKAMEHRPGASLLTEKILHSWRSRLPEDHIDDCCTTINAVMRINDRFVLMSLGDGMLAASSDGVVTVAPEDHTLFANQTRCLSSETSARDIWTAQLEIANSDGPLVVLACTDGIANYLEEGREVDLLSEIARIENQEILQSELESLVLRISEFSTDDKTLGVVRHV